MTDDTHHQDPEEYADEVRARMDELQKAVNDRLPGAKWVLAIQFEDGMGTILGQAEGPGHIIAILAGAIRATVSAESHTEFTPNAPPH